MKKLRKGIYNSLRFICMVLILGAQNLLEGSWTVNKSKQKVAH